MKFPSPQQLKPSTIIFVSLLVIAAVLFTEAALSDFFYSDCLSIGTPFLNCTDNAQVLRPFVVNGNYWYLSVFMEPGTSITETMGMVAGISFLWLLLAFFFLRANRKNGRSIKEVIKGLGESFVFISIVYMIFMGGVVLFIPYCLPGSCRISNALPWLNYIQGFSIAALVVSVYVLLQVWAWIFRARKEVLRKRIIERDSAAIAEKEREGSVLSK